MYVCLEITKSKSVNKLRDLIVLGEDGRAQKRFLLYLKHNSNLDKKVYRNTCSGHYPELHVYLFVSPPILSQIVLKSKYAIKTRELVVVRVRLSSKYTVEHGVHRIIQN